MNVMELSPKELTAAVRDLRKENEAIAARLDLGTKREARMLELNESIMKIAVACERILEQVRALLDKLKG